MMPQSLAESQIDNTMNNEQQINRAISHDRQRDRQTDRLVLRYSSSIHYTHYDILHLNHTITKNSPSRLSLLISPISWNKLVGRTTITSQMAVFRSGIHRNSTVGCHRLNVTQSTFVAGHLSAKIVQIWDL